MEKTVTEPEAIAKEKKAPVMDISMKGASGTFRSAFWDSFVPLISLRYLLVAWEKIDPFGLIGKDYTGKQQHPLPREGFTRNFPALGMGTFLVTGVGLYSWRTYKDMRALYSEAVGFELNKKPEDVGVLDIFWRSRNKAVQTTAGAFITRTLMRMAAAGSFLIPWHRLTPDENPKPNYTGNLDAGVGIASLYLGSEAFLRTQSFFDAQQSLVYKALNHRDNVHAVIQTQDIEFLLMRQRAHLNKHYKWPPLASQEGRDATRLATRIADLLNQTYDNQPNTENDHFTIGKFNYLIGFGMLDKFPESLAFVELANRSSDMKEVKAAAAAIKAGQDPKAVFAALGIDIHNPTEKSLPPTPEPAPGKFTAMLPPKEKIAPKTLLDFAAKTDDTSPSYSTSA